MAQEKTPTPTAQRGACESGAALGCTGVGLNRVQPESLLPGTKPERMIQCTPCFDYSRGRAQRVRTHLAGTR